MDKKTVISKKEPGNGIFHEDPKKTGGLLDSLFKYSPGIFYLSDLKGNYL